MWPLLKHFHWQETHCLGRQPIERPTIISPLQHFNPNPDFTDYEIEACSRRDLTSYSNLEAELKQASVIPQPIKKLKYFCAPPYPFLFLLFAPGSVSRATGTLSNSFSTWQPFKFFKKALIQLLNLSPKEEATFSTPIFSIFLHLAWFYTLTTFSTHSPTGWRHFFN